MPLREDRASVAGGGWSDLWPGEKMLPAAQASPRLARDASGDRGHSQGLLAGVKLLWTAEHRFYRAGESDGPSWNSCPGSSNLGDGAAVPTTARPSGVVACVLSLRASPRSAAGEARAAARTRGQAAGPTLSAPYTSDGCRQIPSTMDNSGGALLPLAARSRLSATQA
jgi:hypothetical protein